MVYIQVSICYCSCEMLKSCSYIPGTCSCQTACDAYGAAVGFLFICRQRFFFIFIFASFSVLSLRWQARRSIQQKSIYMPRIDVAASGTKKSYDHFRLSSCRCFSRSSSYLKLHFAPPFPSNKYQKR